MGDMNENADLYVQELSYRHTTGPNACLAHPWFVRVRHPVYEPRYGCELRPMICGEEVFGSIACDLREAKHTVDIITWGFDPGMVLVRGATAEVGQRYGDLLIEISSRKDFPVMVRVLVWHDDAAAQKKMNNLPGYYGRLFPAVGSADCGYYSDAHRKYNEKWFDQVCAGSFKNLHLHVRALSSVHMPQALFGESLPEGLVEGKTGLVGALYPAHHQKMLLIDYEYPKRSVGYVMGHNSITDFWDTADHLFQDPRRERIYHKSEHKVLKAAEVDIPSPRHFLEYAYSMSEAGAKARAAEAQTRFNNMSHIAKPFQDVSCRLRGPILHDLNHNFCQAWQESTPSSSLLTDLYRVVPIPPAKALIESARAVATSIFHDEMGPGFIKRRAAIPWKAYQLPNGQHNLQLLRTQPMHKEKSVKECYANLTRQMQHYIFIQNQYIQYASWADHLLHCISDLRRSGYHQPIYVFLLTSTPERDGMDSPTYEVASRIGMSGGMKVEHAESVRVAEMAHGAMPITPEKLSKQGIKVVMCSLWTSAKSENPGSRKYEEIYIHSKVAIVDDAALTIGSANLNLRSMAMDTELNVLSDAKDIAYQLRTELFTQCCGAPGPHQFGDMKEAFDYWQAAAQKNSELMANGQSLLSELVPFNVDRKPGRPLL